MVGEEEVDGAGEVHSSFIKVGDGDEAWSREGDGERKRERERLEISLKNERSLSKEEKVKSP